MGSFNGENRVTDKLWSGIDASVEEIMKAKSCSRRAARRMLTSALKKGLLRIRDNVTGEPLDGKAIDKVDWVKGIAILDPNYRSH